MNLRAVRTATLIVIGFGAAATAAVMLHAGDASKFLLFAGFALWALLPYAILYGAARWLVCGVSTSMTVLITALAVAGFGAFCYYDAFFVHLDPQSGLVLVFVPLCQLIVEAVVFGALAIVRFFGPRESNQLG